jgi:hypothetical protein
MTYTPAAKVLVYRFLVTKEIGLQIKSTPNVKRTNGSASGVSHDPFELTEVRGQILGSFRLMHGLFCGWWSSRNKESSIGN